MRQRQPCYADPDCSCAELLHQTCLGTQGEAERPALRPACMLREVTTRHSDTKPLQQSAIRQRVLSPPPYEVASWEGRRPSNLGMTEEAADQGKQAVRWTSEETREDGRTANGRSWQSGCCNSDADTRGCSAPRPPAASPFNQLVSRIYEQWEAGKPRLMRELIRSSPGSVTAQPMCHACRFASCPHVWFVTGPPRSLPQVAAICRQKWRGRVSPVLGLFSHVGRLTTVLFVPLRHVPLEIMSCS